MVVVTQSSVVGVQRWRLIGGSTDVTTQVLVSSAKKERQ